MPKLTKTIVDNTDATDKDIWVWDSEVPGFGIRVQPGGRKTYVARYRTLEAKQRKTTLARCSDMPPDRARDLARKVFAMVAEGMDPALQRREQREAPTILDLCDRYTKEHAQPFKKESSAKRDEINWRVHILPRFRDRKVADITKPDIVNFAGSLVKKPAVANQCIALLSKSMNLAEDWGWRAPGTNPCRRVKKYRIKERELILTPAQISDMDKALTELIEEKTLRFQFGAFIRLLMLTGCRKNEIMAAKRSWVDFERRLLLLPDSKVGQRRIPLAKPAMEIIEQLPEGEWLIPGLIKGSHMVTPYGAWAILKARAKLPKALRLHDLRHTAGSLGHMAGLTQKEIATMLGHRQLSTTERYLHGLVGNEVLVADRMSAVIAENWKPA